MTSLATVKNGTSLTDIKEGLVANIAPKYFDNIKELSELNIGLYGYVTEVLANTAKDSYFTIASLFKEMFITQAELPESIYNHALLFQLSNFFGKAAVVPFTILIAEDAVIEASTNGEGDYLYFDMDSSMEFNIEGLTFMLDYDVRIVTKKTSTGYIHAASYLMNNTNSISDLRNPYITTSIYVNDNKKRYIILSVKLHQVAKKTVSDVIITNDLINVVTLNYKFDDMLANFEIYYKAPGEVNYIQLKKQLANTNNLSQPFCFYKLIDSDTLQITFSSDDRFFRPEYNSDIIVEIYTTKGSEGNFNIYEGADINVVGKSDKYASNRGIVFMGTVTGASVGGADTGSLEDLRESTMKAYSTVKSFTTSNDLNLYFDTIQAESPSKVLFMKKRDDAFERLYSAFVLFRDKDNNVIPTNTLDMRIYSKDITVTMPQSHRNVIPAGLLYETIEDTSGRYVKVSNDIRYEDDLDQYEKSKFLYVNPYLVIVCTNPISVSFYLNTVNQILSVAHIDIGSDSIYQFIVDNIQIERDALSGQDEYTITTRLAPNIRLPEQPHILIRDDTYVDESDRTFVNDYDGYEYIDNGNLSCIIEVLDRANNSKLYAKLEYVGFDEEAYIFQGKLKTSDYVSTNNDIQITGGFKSIEEFTEDTDPVLIPATDCHMNIYCLYIDPDAKTDHKTHIFSDFDEMKEFTLTNKYTLVDDELATWLYPINEIRSTVDYTMKEPSGKYGFKLEAIPLVKANYLKMDGTKSAFTKIFTEMYEYIDTAKEKLTNNFAIDLKYFNTYGPSDHYIIAGDEDRHHIDRVNISLYFDAKYNIASNEEAQTAELKDFIKTFTEKSLVTLASSPSFYISTLIAEAKEKFSGIKYLVFKGINEYGANIQALESEVNESNIIQGVIETSKVIPEYLNIDQIIKEGTRTPQIFINVIK